MKIAHFLLGRCNPDSANGVDKAVYFLSKAQASLGHSVKIFSLTSKDAIPVPGVEVSTYSPMKIRLCLPKELTNDLLNWHPDIVHLHSAYVPENAAIAKLLSKSKIPYVVSPHGGLTKKVLARAFWRKYPYKYIVERPFLNRAALIHALSDSKDIYAYGVNVPIVTIPNGIDLATIPNNLNSEFLISRFPHLQGKFVFLYLGRLDVVQKGIDIFLKAYSIIQSKNAVVLLVGPDSHDSIKKIKMLLHHLSIEEKVILYGPAYGKEKYDLLTSSNIVFLTSLSEGLPFSVLEAASVGRPCLVTPVADPLGKLSFYSAGWIVETKVESIADGISRILAKSPDEIRDMGARARQMVEKEFDWNRIAQSMICAYKEYGLNTK